MFTTNLRRVGGSVMLAVPPAVLDLLNLRSGVKVGLSVEGERLIVEARPKPRYTLDELLAQCDAKARRTKDERDWLAGGPAGRELI
jgi:antitoxin ChpS